MTRKEQVADPLPDELSRLQGALDRLSHLCVGVCREERDLFANLLQSLHLQISGDVESIDICDPVLSAYWRLYDWAVEVIVDDEVEAEGYAIRECIIERVCSARHPFLVRCEREPPERVSRYLRQVFCRDLGVLQQLAKANWPELVERCIGRPIEHMGEGDDKAGGVSALGNFPLQALKEHLRRSEAWDADWLDIARLVHTQGLPPFRSARAFSICNEGDGIRLAPIKDFASFPLDWLEGNGERIEALVRNTRHMLAGNRAHNVLIWGPRGGGKSSLIRALIDVYYEQGLRGIEIAPEDYGDLRAVFAVVRARREFFIGVLDNISLVRGDSSLHHLSRILDGGLESVPENMVFYATSNFKDLVDRDGERMQGLGVMQMEAEGAPVKISTGIRPDFYDPQQNQRIDELRALDDRFALKVFIDLPRKSEYEHMVISYAQRAGLTIAETELLSQFNTWRMRHNHDLVGGRTARDFVLDLVSNLSEK